MAGEESYSLATLLRAGGVPFIFLAGYDAYQIPEEGKSAPYLEKPTDSEELVAMMVREFGWT